MAVMSKADQLAEEMSRFEQEILGASADAPKGPPPPLLATTHAPVHPPPLVTSSGPRPLFPPGGPLPPAHGALLAPRPGPLLPGAPPRGAPPPDILQVPRSGPPQPPPGALLPPRPGIPPSSALPIPRPGPPRAPPPGALPPGAPPPGAPSPGAHPPGAPPPGAPPPGAPPPGAHPPGTLSIPRPGPPGAPPPVASPGGPPGAPPPGASPVGPLGVPPPSASVLRPGPPGADALPIGPPGAPPPGTSYPGISPVTRPCPPGATPTGTLPVSRPGPPGAPPPGALPIFRPGPPPPGLPPGALHQGPDPHPDPGSMLFPSQSVAPQFNLPPQGFPPAMVPLPPRPTLPAMIPSPLVTPHQSTIPMTPVMMPVPLPVQAPSIPMATIPISNSKKTGTEAAAIDLDSLPIPTKPPKRKKDPKKLRLAGGKAWEDRTLDEWDPNDFRIFVGDLGNDVNDDTLARAFSKYPTFQKAKVIRERQTKKTKGYGFVSFKDPHDFMQAMREMNGKYIGNRPMKLRKSVWRERCFEVVKKKDKEKKRLGFR